jgi:hypothetical protein
MMTGSPVTLLALDDINHFYRYEFKDISYPVTDYKGHFRFTPDTAVKGSLVEWSATLDVPDEPADQVVELQIALFGTRLKYYEVLL